MPVSERQLAAFADTHAWQVLFDTSPRHLAGAGDGRRVTHGLATAGWARTSDPLSPEIVLTSPNRRHSLQFVQRPSPLAPQQVVEAHTARLDAVRAQARAPAPQQQPKPATATAKAGSAPPSTRR